MNETTRQAPQPRAIRWLFYGLFFVSGACGLAYEIIWTRLFIPVFGIGLYSASAVSAAFLGGLALGGYACGRLIDRRTRLLRYYALLEVLAGAAALLLPRAIGAAYGVMPYLHNYVSADPWVLAIFRFFTAFGLLIIPCALIGATLPVMSRFFALVSRRNIGGDFSALYASNVLGAAAGCGLAAFFMLEALGIRGASVFFAAVNILLGALAFSLSLIPGFPGSAAAELPPPAENSARAAVRGRAMVPALSFLAGFCFLSFELLLLRALASLVPNDAYTFPVLLMSVLAGNALGYAFVSPRLARLRNFPLAAGSLLAGGGLVMAASLRFIPLLPQIQGWYPWAVCLAMALPSSILAGMALPTLVSWYSSGYGSVGRDVGDVYSMNTLGAMAGSFVTPFILVPALGLRDAFFCVVAAYGLTGITAAAAAVSGNMAKRAALALASLVILFGTGKLLHKDLFRDIFVFYLSDGKDELVFYREGVVTSSGLFRSGSSPKDYFYHLQYPDKSSGGAEAAPDGTFRRNHRLKAHLPLLLHPRPETVLNIGLGSGISSETLALHDNLRKIETVELVAETRDALPYYVKDAAGMFGDGRSSLAIDDGRNFLLTTPRAYDVILSYPYFPLFGETIHLYTREYFELCRSKLNPGGLAVVWFPAKFLGKEASGMLINTFLEVFPYASLWSTRMDPRIENVAVGGMLIGTADKAVYDAMRGPFAGRLASLSRPARASLEASNVRVERDLLARRIADMDGLKAYASGTAGIVTDDRTILDLRMADRKWRMPMNKGLGYRGRRGPPI